MISMASLRFKDGDTFDMGTQELTVDRAFEHFILHELGYGGKIDYVSPTKVMCKTNVMGCIDTTTFTGEPSDMLLFYHAASIHSNPHTASSTVLGLMVNMFNGMATVRNVLCALIDPYKITHYIILDKVPTRDLLACVLLMHNDKLDIEEAMSLL